MDKMTLLEYGKRNRLNTVSVNVHREIGSRLDEDEARGMVEGIIENHMGVVIDVLAKRGIKDRATVEAIKDFVRDR